MRTRYSVSALDKVKNSQNRKNPNAYPVIREILSGGDAISPSKTGSKNAKNIIVAMQATTNAGHMTAATSCRLCVHWVCKPYSGPGDFSVRLTLDPQTKHIGSQDADPAFTEDVFLRGHLAAPAVDDGLPDGFGIATKQPDIVGQIWRTQ